LTVTARSQPPRSSTLDHEGFYDREKTGFGIYLTPYELSQKHAMHTAELFRGLAGVQVVPTGSQSYSVIMSRGASQNCPPNYVVDGGSVMGGDLDNMVQPQDIEGIEIYRGPSEIPGRWMGMRSACGLIVIWTKRGERNH
jgi:hypothetical protein